MALELKVGILNNKSAIIITEDTGNYNAVTNPTGWGSPNAAYTNPPVTAISLNIYYPSATTPSVSNINLLATTFFTSTDRAYNLTSAITLQDGVWKYVVNYTISSINYSVTKYALRDNVIRCLIGQLALSDMDTNNFEEVKLLYDKMVQAFECEEYILAQELYQEIKDALADCSPYISNCNC